MATALTTTMNLNHFQSHRRPRQGILLSQHQHQLHHFPTQPSPPPRRIRFAPLPDPRRSVLITDDGNELPLPNTGSATQFPAPPTPSPALDSRLDYFSPLDSASLASTSTDSKRNSALLDPSSSSYTSSTSGTATPVSFTTTTPSEYDTNSSVPPSPVSCPPSPLVAVSTKLTVVSASKGGPFSFLRSLKRNSTSSSSSSSNTLTPTPSIDRTHTPTATSFSRRNFSAEEILTLGTINLFRASSSRDTSDNEGASSSGWSLARWSSAGSHHTHTHHHKDPNWGSPLARVSSTQSTQSYQSKSKKSSSSTLSTKGFRPSSTGGLRPTRKGTRMLNGRVYGVKRPNANPFANARDEEPEFVEWGYGGMGSVKGATSAGAHGRWGRLQGQSATSATPAPVGAPAADEEDDGSGMMWVKKRREQRERERKEKEELEKVEKGEEKEEAQEEIEIEEKEEKPVVEKPTRREELSRPGTASSAKTVSAASSCTVTPCNYHSTSPTALATVPVLSTSPTPSTLSPVATITSPTIEEEHVTRAVTVPAPHHYIHHHRLHSRAGSKDAMLGAVVADAEKEKESENGNRSSESESESDVEIDEDTDEDSEEESEEEGRRRRTAVGAGVEKVSRHH